MIGPLEAGAPSPNRIKRHIQGPAHRFALVFPPGFEAEGRAEALALGIVHLEPEEPRDKGAAADASVLEWEGRLGDLYRASLFLRIPSRIFLRMKPFRAGAREELFAQTRRLPWELLLSPCRLRIEAHLEHCRISHEGQAAATVLEAIRQRWAEAGLKAPGDAAGDVGGEASLEALDSPDADIHPSAGVGAGIQRLVLRMEDNHGTLSLDCSGQGLYHRGWRQSQGQAPLRENLAAGLLRMLGWPAGGVLVDGMTGSGTFALEGLAMARAVSPFADTRHFPFMDWPSFQESAFAWQKRQTVGESFGEASIHGVEWHQGVFEKAGENLGHFIQGREALLGAGGGVDFREGDFFDLNPGEFGVVPGSRGWLILNPPYGLRLDDGEGSLYPRLWKHLAGPWSAWTIGVLAPDGRSPPEKSDFTRAGRFRHGGLRINFWTNTRARRTNS